MPLVSESAMPMMNVRGNTHAINALRVWQILTAHAILRETVSFGRVGELLGWGVGGRAVGGEMLDMIANYCYQEEYPDLTWVLVNKGKDYISRVSIFCSPEDQRREREVAFGFPWFNAVPPTTEQLISAPNSPYTDFWRGRQIQS